MSTHYIYLVIALALSALGVGAIFYSYRLSALEDVSFIGNAYRGSAYFFTGVLCLLAAIITIFETVKHMPL